MRFPKLSLWPTSLLGQTLLALAAALLIAQSISAVLLLRAAENRLDQAVLTTAAFRLIGSPGAENDRFAQSRRGDSRREQRGGGGAGRMERAAWAQGLPVPIRTESTEQSPVLAGETRLPDKEAALRRILTDQGINPGEVVAVERPLASDPLSASRPRVYARITRNVGDRAMLLVAAVRTAPAQEWTVARVVIPPAQRGAFRTIVLQTGLIFLFLMGLQFLVLRRIVRPLKLLTTRTERFARTQEPSQPLASEGPGDIRRLIGAHNAMEARIGALLDEKDVMLGAIGHDLKTPLAALRVRIESVEDERERGRMAASIEDITRSLDDILSLARVGRAADAPERTELSALAASVTEEFEDMGQPVTLGATSRIVHPVHVTWLRRALRNLISNAVRYGKSAEVSLLRDGPNVILRVEDNGPGIPDGRIEAMMEPFTRGEASRNRDTGGAGLGLTLARAIAEQHGGQLVLANRLQGGLRAEIRLPSDPPKA